MNYPPLQKCEYENGLSVNGVSDVDKWAIEAGLAENMRDLSNDEKKKKVDVYSLPSKFGDTSTTNPDLEDNTKDTIGKEEEMDIEEKATTQLGPIDKGKKPMEEQ
ncbi:hypothetical protein M758_UG296000 [Ceratodon purpureus]|nr:hypothetical protein M758_UG296000 [Ceratodon purpureus]